MQDGLQEQAREEGLPGIIEWWFGLWWPARDAEIEYLRREINALKDWKDKAEKALLKEGII